MRSRPGKARGCIFRSRAAELKIGDSNWGPMRCDPMPCKSRGSSEKKRAAKEGDRYRSTQVFTPYFFLSRCRNAL